MASQAAAAYRGYAAIFSQFRTEQRRQASQSIDVVEPRVGQKGLQMFRRTTVLMSVLKRLTSFHGRAGRGDFWAVLLLTTAVTVILLLHPASAVSTGAIQVKKFLFVIFLIQIASPVILAAYTSRRLHDLNKPSWWTVPFLVALISLPTIWTPTGQLIIGALAGAAALESVGFVLTGVLASVVMTFLYLLSLKGAAEPNEHGPAPGDFDLPYLLVA